MHTREWNPLNDQHPNLRDVFAMNEHSTPNVQVADAEKMLGLLPGTYQLEKHLPLLLAKWRYAVADAMLKEGGYLEPNR